MNKDEWITAQEAVELTGKHYETIRNYCRKGVLLCERAVPGKGASPLMINKASIPSFMRVKKEEDMTADQK